MVTSQLMTAPVGSKTILTLSLTQLRYEGIISIESTATPCRVRFINCHALVEEDTLVIDEFEDFPFPLNPDSGYAAISYVWKGNPMMEHEEEAERLGYFNVLGAESGDPISIHALRSACFAAQKAYSDQIEYIWLDRLCIIQNNQEDKSWQITRMFEVYKNADLTIILPGGIQRLVGLDEETAWVHRAWTLQEALAPNAALVLHQWDEEEGAVGSWDTDTAGSIRVIQAAGPGRRGYALTDLDNLIEACTVGRLRWTPGSWSGDETPQEIEAMEWRTVENVRIIGQPGTPSLHALLDALRTLDDGADSFKYYAIWKSALTRTSSRPVDMVLSIMGLFGVTLDPRLFEVGDRVGATIALSREILRRGGTASWIGISTRAPPCRHLSTFPEFPETSVAGKAWIRANGNQEMIDAGTIVDEDSHIGSGPTIPTKEYMIGGDMDEAGYLNFRRKACIVTPVANFCLRIIEDPTSQHLSAESVDGIPWHFHEGNVAAVSLSEKYNEFFKMMLVQEHTPGRCHVVSYFKIPNLDTTWDKHETNWKKYEFTVGSKTILSLSLTQLRHESIISIESTATPGRIRFISCHALVEEDTLVIDEFEDFPFPLNPDSGCPAVMYAAISYVWKGNPIREHEEEAERLGYFNVLGAESGDPISIHALRSACLAAQTYSDQIEYIWFDRPCIIQNHKEDKAWQITRMFEVYKNADVTIILPGGIQRLVGLDEETAWVHRAWTLQEALAPDAALVLHRWEEEEGAVGNWKADTPGAIQVIQAAGPGRRGCASTNLDNLIEACTVGRLRWTPGTLREDETPQEIEAREWRTVENVKIIGQPGTPSLNALLDALRTLYDGAGSSKYYSIWKCALTRTSSRPVDMVFSIMGLFGVTLDPMSFRTEDRIGATIALSREILRRGGSASWIGISTHAPPCRQLSTFPEFPETSVAGKAWIKVKGNQETMIEAGTIVDEDAHIGKTTISTREYMIEGDMDEAGYLNFRRKACVVTPGAASSVPGLMDCAECLRIMEDPASQHLSVESVDGRTWHFHEGVNFDQYKFPRTAAVVVGYVATTSLSEEYEEFLKLMLVQEHVPGRCHVVSYFKIPNFDWIWENETNWKEFEFSVGGPDIA
ncbi:hypothetical protein K435DRAFT_846342 [Dendrothele bispora CBS 962.96]|uniref:Heterokaryon incompatibility domain-containing protein n=1 Tax=Dendrothele bispora (strain CBS 962.96) TaxID=1314807 RepID=A0A4S8KNA2_DENBC|nr:hypothetical protein K435DRAFT_846342 [Dendrothele bispora CBS 962.96]